MYLDLQRLNQRSSEQGEQEGIGLHKDFLGEPNQRVTGSRQHK